MKNQSVAIQEEIRDQMGLNAGDQFLVVAEKGVMILKMIRIALDTNVFMSGIFWSGNPGKILDS